MRTAVFENIKNIAIKKPTTWENKIFLTFDIDWANDSILSYTIDIVEKYDIKATFFATHETRLLKRLRDNPKIEIGIHPNFNFLLKGDFRYGKNIKEIVRFYKRIVPEAKSVRSHSMTQSTEILKAFSEHQLKFDCNHFVPFDRHLYLEPWILWDTKLIKVPYFWEDDIHCMYDWKWNPKVFTDRYGLKVFDFHPSHIFLNTENVSKYERNRELLRNSIKLGIRVNTKNYGIYNFLVELIESNI